MHILKRRRHKLDPKSQEMIFIGYEPGSKGYQFWDAAHQHIEISRDVKFNETLFPVKEATKSQASQNDLPISESDNESDTSGLELVIPAQSSQRPPSPGQSALRPPGSQTHPPKPTHCPNSGFTGCATFQIRSKTCLTWTPNTTIFPLPYQGVIGLPASILWRKH